MKRKLAALAAAALAVCICTAMAFQEETRSVSQGLLRLHVVAATGSEEDLERKEAVRDAVLAEWFADPSEDLEATLRYARAHLADIRATAEETLRSMGCDDGVTVRLGREFLPEKHYEGFALPAGEYETLRVTVGKGEGSNWWCVLFPPLCVAPASAVAETAREAGISQSGWKLMTSDGTEVRVRFRIAELFAKLEQKLRKKG